MTGARRTSSPAARARRCSLVLPPSVSGVKGINDYASLMQYDIQQLANTLQLATAGR